MAFFENVPGMQVPRFTCNIVRTGASKVTKMVVGGHRGSTTIGWIGIDWSATTGTEVTRWGAVQDTREGGGKPSAAIHLTFVLASVFWLFRGLLERLNSIKIISKNVAPEPCVR